MTKKLSKALAVFLSLLCVFSAAVTSLAAPAPTYIGEAAAKEAALAHAGLTEGDVNRMKISLDYDDGIACYEISFESGTTEYEYEINALTGAIMEYDRDMTWYGELLFWINRILVFFGLRK